MKEAMFYSKVKEKVKCELCPHYCVLSNNEKGKCNVRENNNGKLYSLVYGKVVANSIDPIEKKPLFHFMPGSFSYSIATVGCNFKCEFCQNCEISQPDTVIGKEMTPEEVVQDAVDNGCQSISYTYTEPTIFTEFALDAMKLAKKKGLKNIFVSNGFINKEPIKKISMYLDAINIDLKSFSDDFYKKVIGGRLQPVLDSIKQYYEEGVFLEITTLLIPGENDSDEELKQIAEFIASVDNNIPWHVSRFHPMHKMNNKPVTPRETLIKAVEIGKKAGLKYIYAGNIPGNDYESTYCPKCRGKVIERFHFSVDKINLKDENCEFCGEKINVKGVNG